MKLKRHDYYILLGLLVLYFFTRFISIRILPPFNDEFIYVRWAQEGFFDPAQRLMSLGDGKQPLFIWLTSLLMNVIHSPLAAGRIVSVISGFLTMVGLGVLSYQLFKNKIVSYVSGFLYIVFPHALLLDRFALFDSLLGAFSVWSLVGTYYLSQQPSLGIALFLALIVGAALLVKSSALFLFMICPIIILLFSRSRRMVLLSLFYFVITAIVSLLYQSVLYLSPNAAYIAEKNQTFAYTISQLYPQLILEQVVRNLSIFLSWIVSYMTWPLLAVLCISGFFSKKFFRSYVFLWCATAIPFFIIVIIGKTVYPRHLFFSYLPLLVLTAHGLVRGWRLSRLLIVLSMLPMVLISTKIIVDYANAPIPAMDRFQYVEGWPSGWGIKDAASYLENESHRGVITILTEGLYGSMTTTAMELYLGNYPQVRILPFDDIALQLPGDIDWSHPVFVLLNKTQYVPGEWRAKEILKTKKGNGSEYFRLLKLSAPIQ